MSMIVHYDTVLYLTAGVATTLWAGRFEGRIPVGFSGPLPALPKAHPESCIMGTGSLSRGVNRPGRGVEPLSSADVEYSSASPLCLLTMLRDIVYLFVLLSRLH
jgi:hypothetical protein